jgi:TLD
VICCRPWTNTRFSDGHYGLWVDSGLEKGVSAQSQTFGNEPLSDEGVKFDILGVEVWYVGS